MSREAKVQWAINEARRAWRDAITLMNKKDRLVARGIDTTEVDEELAWASAAIDRAERKLAEAEGA